MHLRWFRFTGPFHGGLCIRHDWFAGAESFCHRGARFRRRSRKPTIVFRQIVPLQMHGRCLVTGDFLPSQFLHQPVPMRAVLPLHSSLGLRRTGRDHRDLQLRGHPPKLRDRLFSSQLLIHRGRSFVQITTVKLYPYITYQWWVTAATAAPVATPMANHLAARLRRVKKVPPCAAATAASRS